MSRYSSGSSRDLYPPPPQYSRNSRQDSARYLDDNDSHSSQSGRPRSKWEAAADKAGGNDRPFQRSSEPLYDDDEDSDALQIRTGDIQTESLQSTRRTMSRIRETELIAQSNLTKIAAQGEQLSHIERKLDLADQRALEADAKTNELKKLNRPFFLPTWGAKSARNEGGIAARESQRQDRDLARQTEISARNERLQRVMDTTNKPKYGPLYTTPTGVERDEVEQELDSNLDEISGGLSRLKMMATAMNEDLDGQNGSFTRITSQAETVKVRVDNTHKKVQKFLPKAQREK